MLSEVIAELEPLFGDPGLVVIPVPLYPVKQRQRGFNQSEMIAHVALKLSSRKGFRHGLRADILVRARETKSQIGLTRHQRRENLRGAFRVAKPEAVSGREILLVDDVFTTGTTASECARVLRRAGATRVWVATVARTLKADAQSALLEPDTDSAMSMAAHGS
jgi:ComF family protein